MKEEFIEIINSIKNEAERINEKLNKIEDKCLSLSLEELKEKEEKIIEAVDSLKNINNSIKSKLEEEWG